MSKGDRLGRPSTTLFLFWRFGLLLLLLGDFGTSFFISIPIEQRRRQCSSVFTASKEEDLLDHHKNHRNDKDENKERPSSLSASSSSLPVLRRPSSILRPDESISNTDEYNRNNSRYSEDSFFRRSKKKKLELLHCEDDDCRILSPANRERVIGRHNQIMLNGPATGQVAYFYNEEVAAEDEQTPALFNGLFYDATGGYAQQVHPEDRTTKSRFNTNDNIATKQCVLFLVKQQPGGSTSSSSSSHASSTARQQQQQPLLQIAADAIRNLTHAHPDLQILLDPGTAARIKHYYGVESDQIHLFEPRDTPGYGQNPTDTTTEIHPNQKVELECVHRGWTPDLIVTIGGDGLLMHAAMLFQGPIPPVLCVAGGSLGFLTPFQPSEMVQAVQVALGLSSSSSSSSQNTKTPVDDDFENENYFHFNPNHDDDDDHGMIPAYSPSPDKMQTKRFPSYKQKQKYNGDNDPTATTANDLPKPPTKLCFGHGDRICLSIRMRLDCRIISKRDGIVKARYNVLNEVVIDRGLSPYLTILECFCDDEHLTTVQADGVIFATPTGSTAYSLAAGSSVVHPAVPCILVTPICPHVLSFRSMVFPDHVVLRAYVPHDARSEASISFDGKHRQELRRGDSVEIRMSSYPVPTINRKDHSADWLHSLKRGLYFNARPKQMPF